MLQAMRRSMKVVLWVTIIFFVLLIFLVWGADLQFGNEATPTSAGTINGEAISRADYQQILAANRDNARRGGQDLQPSDELLIEEQSWNAIVNDILVRQEAERRGIRAKDSEIRSTLLNNPPAFITQDPNFLNAQGQFDLATYRALLSDPATPDNFLLQLEGYVRTTLPSEKLQEIILASAKVTDEELRRAYQVQNERAKVSYVLVDALRTQVDSQVSDEELAAYHQEHAAKYRKPKRVDLIYVAVPRTATSADSVTLQTDLTEMAAEARRAEADRAAGRENVKDSDLETLALTFSDAPSTDNGGLSTGYLTPEQMSPAMKTVVDGLAVGEISGPFLDGPFYRIVKVEDEQMTDDGVRSVQIRELAMRIGPSDDTILATRDELEELRTAAAAGGLRAAAEARGMTVSVAPNVEARGVAPGLTALPQIAAFAHENDTGTVSRVMETNNSWYVVEVGEIKPEGLVPLDEVKNQVRSDLLRDRRFAAARPRADRMAGEIKLGRSLEEVADAESLTVTTTAEFTRAQGIQGLGQDSEVIGAAFSLPVNTVSDVIESSRGWVLLRVDERAELDWTGFEAQRNQLLQSRLAFKQNQILNEFMQRLRREAKIQDFRS